MALLIWSPNAASAAAPTCVVKLSFSSSEKSDSGTDAFVKQVLTAEGYKIIDDWLLTIWSSSDYEVKIAITHTVVPNYGFPVDLAGMQVFIADSSGTFSSTVFSTARSWETTSRLLSPRAIRRRQPRRRPIWTRTRRQSEW